MDKEFVRQFSEFKLAASVFLSLVLFLVIADYAVQPYSVSTKGAEKTFTTPIDMANSKTTYEVTDETITAVADGIYETNSTYAFHSGVEHIHINIKLKDQVVTEAGVVGIDGSPSNPMSKKIMENFNAALPELVVGKKITELDIPKNVAGSSLTSAAFKKYVEQIVTDNAN